MSVALAAEPRRAGIYLRISADRENDELGVKRQLKECKALARRLGWELVEVFIDNDQSAYKRKVRPDFSRLKEWTQDGRINAWKALQAIPSLVD